MKGMSLVVLLLSILTVAGIKVRIASAVDENYPCYGMAQPVLKNLRDSIDGPPAAGMLMITTTFNTNCQFKVPYVAFFEVRDAKGNTIYLQFQTGKLNAYGDTDLGLSWQPKETGKYELRAFAISNFTQPQILTSVATGEAIVT